MTIEELRRLSGVGRYRNSFESTGSNISVTASEKARIQREKNIQPGDPEWFRLWFSLPFLTGEKPTGATRHR